MASHADRTHVRQYFWCGSEASVSHCEWVGVRRSFYGLKGSEEVIRVGAGDISTDGWREISVTSSLTARVHTTVLLRC